MTESSWTNYWFRSAPLADIAILRILAVACQLFLVHLPILGLEHASWGPDLSSLRDIYLLPENFFDPLLILVIPSLPFGEISIPPFETVQLIWWITLIAGLLGLVGLLTNPSLLIFVFGSVFLQALQFSVRDIHHAEAVMMIALGVLALSPCGSVLSVDSLFRRLKSSKQFSEHTSFLGQESSFAGWPIRLMQWMFVLLYLSAVASKVLDSGLSWPNGYTLAAILVFQDYRLGSPLGVWLSEYRLLLMVAQWIVLLFQTTFILAVLFPALRWFYVPMGLGFHISSYFLLDAYFYQWIVLYAVFVPWSFVLEAGRSRIFSKNVSGGDNASGLDNADGV